MGGLFDDVLQDNESLFIDQLALDYDFIPKEIPFRENQHQYIADCIKPLFNRRSGRNLFISGAPGIGKTVAVKHVLRELENTSDRVYPIYINCWKFDSSYKILLEICNQVGYKWIHNKRTDELLRIVPQILNKKSAVVCLDEVDRIKELDVLYSLSEDLSKKVIIIIANDETWVKSIEPRVKSRLMADSLEFKPYSFEETKGILKDRVGYSFVEGVWDKEALELVCAKCFEARDIRVGLFLLKEAGNSAEMKASRKIKLEFAKEAVSKLDHFKIKDSTEFDPETQNILELIRNNSGLTIKELFDLHSEDISYRTFHRKIEELDKNMMIELGEKRGKSPIVNYSKKLTDF